MYHIQQRQIVKNLLVVVTILTVDGGHDHLSARLVSAVRCGCTL